MFKIGDIVHLKTLYDLSDFSRPGIIINIIGLTSYKKYYSIKPLRNDKNLSGIYAEEALILDKKLQREQKLKRILRYE